LSQIHTTSPGIPRDISRDIAQSVANSKAVQLRNVSRTFAGGVRAVNGIDLEIGRGEFVALLGPSGCGKSTILRMIAGLDHPDAGSVRTVASAGQSRPAVAYVFQDANLLPWRNVLKNVALPLELMRVEKSDRLARAAAALAQVGLSDAILRYPAALSGGMKMRASLARALVTEPELLLLDEPFAALDEITRQHLDEQLRNLWLNRKMTILFVTHSTIEAAFLADRAIVFSSRPATIVLDHKLDLPAQRIGSLRADSHFAQQTRVLFEALDRGGA
jgi:NitT/TauT family transport system ATP-binding protein